MVNIRYDIRNAQVADHTRIANLMYFESKVHRHLDWRAPLDWLGVPEYWILEDAGNTAAVLACPPDPETVSWLRLFAVAGFMSQSQAWDALWGTARASLAGRGILAAAIATQDWLKELLAGSGFEEKQKIVVLEHTARDVQVRSAPVDVSIRQMTQADLPVVAEVDAAAFGRLWQNSLPSLGVAFAQSELATVALAGDEIVGYQMSTRNPFGAHLARLAVKPVLQGRGLGYFLVQDLLEQVHQAGFSRVTVNTQGDNDTSLALYGKIGFKRTGETYTVYTCDL